jgi:ribose-phosphate pyrophosphokinase
VGPKAVLIDDILDTGSTLVAACEKFLHAQVQEIYIMITHGLFTGDVWQKLWSLRVRRIFCTDTVPLPGSFAKEKITVLSLLPLLRQAIICMEDEKILAMAARLD